ncbi:MAG: SRPBCC family protein [Bacteroidia bacterium]|nr:SRPBCC family protein [Bacteroidia bacterium]
MMTIESKVGKILRPIEDIYGLLSDFRRIVPLLPPEHVKDVIATEDTCTFNAEGVGTMEIKIVNREPFGLIKYTGGENTPMQFFFWVQLKEASPGDTRIKLTLKADVPKMMQFMVKSKIEKALNDLVDKISASQ